MEQAESTHPGPPKPALILVCFAVPEEAKYFLPPADVRTPIRKLIVGMGAQNAEQSLRASLLEAQPGLIITCGFAGGLKPGLATGTVVFSAEFAAGFEPWLARAGAVPIRFHCVDRVVTTAGEKRRLRDATGADAVEMESGTIASISREQRIPCVVLRVILDILDEDLPLDFNQVMNSRQELDYARLAWALVKAPGRIAPLLRLQKQSQAASRNLGNALNRFLCNFQ